MAVKDIRLDLERTGRDDAHRPARQEAKPDADPYREDELVRMDLDGSNFIVTVGLPKSGKSVFQNHLVRYIVKACRHLEARPTPVRGGPDGEVALARWERLWAEGWF